MNQIPKKTRRYQDMSKAELRRATKQYDAEMIDVPSVKPPTALAARHAQAMKRAKAAARRPGRPTVGAGATAVLVSIERRLLDEANKYAKAKGMSRSELIALGLQTVMKKKTA
jgi:hypothetical protein